MPSGNPSRLLALADREFRELTNKPLTIEPTRKFRPVNLNVARFDNSWERKRGAAVRLTAVLLREDDTTLERRVCENEVSAKTYADAVAWFGESPSICGRSRSCWIRLAEGLRPFLLAAGRPDLTDLLADCLRGLRFQLWRPSSIHMSISKYTSEGRFLALRESSCRTRSARRHSGGWQTYCIRAGKREDTSGLDTKGRVLIC